MTDIKKLDNPPIKEAIIELRFQKSLELSADEYVVIKSKFNTKYQSEDLYSTQLKFAFGKNKDVAENNRNSQIIGVVLKNPDDNYSVTIQNEKVTISKFRPYDSFEHLVNILKEIIEVLSNYLVDTIISRVGLRYINQIKDSEDYLKHILKFPEFKFDVDFNDEENEEENKYFQCIVNNGNNEKTIFNYLINLIEKSVIIDIDCIKEKHYPQNQYELIWNDLEKLRKRKNRIFFDIVSDKIGGCSYE